MMLDPDIENLFGSVPLLARVPRAEWRVTPLGSITNRVYRLKAGADDLVLRWPGASASRYLDRATEGGNAAAVADLGLAPPVLAADPDIGWYMTTFEEGAIALTGEDFADPAILAETAGLLTQLHRSRIRFPFQQGLFQAIDLYLDLAPTPLMTALRRRLDPVEAALARRPGPRVPCHIDPNPANFLRRRNGGLYLIDWEFAAMEEALWDLAAITLEARLDSAAAQGVMKPFVAEDQLPRFELYRTALLLVAGSWAEMELAAGNPSPELAALRDDRVRRLEARLADPQHGTFLSMA